MEKKIFIYLIEWLLNETRLKNIVYLELVMCSFTNIRYVR